MYEVFTKLLNMSLTASILVLLVVIIRFVLKKAPKKYVCILWALVAIRLICPFSISSSFSAYNVLQENTISSGQVEYFEYNGKTEKPLLTFEAPALVNDNYSPDSMTIGTKQSGIYMPTVVYIWVSGVIIMLGYAVVSYAQLRKEVEASIKKNGNIYVCDEINSPFILGIIRPRIYLPSGISEEVSENVVAHEKAHIKRLDYLWKPLGFVLLSVYWFNPVMWIAYIFLCKDVEAACDEKVISQMDREHIAEYSQALLTCAVQRRLISACPVAFGETDVKGRIRNVLSYKKPAFWIVCLSIIACIVVAVCFLTNPQEKENNSEFTTGLYTGNASSENLLYSNSSLLINDDGTFSFSPSFLSSYLGLGSWEKDGKYIIFNDRGMGDNRKIVFLYDDCNLIFDADRSDSNLVWGLSEGAVFIYRDKSSLLEYLVTEKDEISLISIIDTSLGGEYAEVLEEFFHDDTYTYYFPMEESQYLECHFSDGSIKTFMEAIDSGMISVSDLDKNSFIYWKVDNDNNWIFHNSATQEEMTFPEGKVKWHQRVTDEQLENAKYIFDQGIDSAFEAPCILLYKDEARDFALYFSFNSYIFDYDEMLIVSNGKKTVVNGFAAWDRTDLREQATAYDLDKDGFEEIIIIAVTGTGTGYSHSSYFVFDSTDGVTYDRVSICGAENIVYDQGSFEYLHNVSGVVDVNGGTITFTHGNDEKYVGHINSLIKSYPEINKVRWGDIVDAEYINEGRLALTAVPCFYGDEFMGGTFTEPSDTENDICNIVYEIEYSKDGSFKCTDVNFKNMRK